MYRLCVKRIIDFVFAVFGLILTLPLLIVVTVFVSIKTHGKPFFFQQRPGLNNRIFTILKFCTMTDEKDKNGILLSDKERITQWGNFLRKTSIDELPQLFNIIKGEMSFIGPRPLLIEYLPFYSERQKKRHEVCPGITGWAQVNGRNTISWQQKFEYDVWYVEHLSFCLDLKIVCMTIKKIFSTQGVNYGDGITMPKFDGNRE